MIDELRPEDFPAAARLLAAAFEGDAAYAWVSPQGAARRPYLERVFSVHLGIDRANGAGGFAARRDGRLAGLALLFPPGTRSGSVLDWLRGAHRLGPVLLHPWLCLRGLRLQAAIDAAKPRDPRQAYLKLLAVDPSEHGRGTGTALLEAAAGRAKGEGWSLYLETATRKNEAYYRKRGFARLEDLEVRGLPRMFRLRRS